MQRQEQILHLSLLFGIESRGIRRYARRSQRRYVRRARRARAEEEYEEEWEHAMAEHTAAMTRVEAVEGCSHRRLAERPRRKQMPQPQQ